MANRIALWFDPNEYGVKPSSGRVDRERLHRQAAQWASLPLQDIPMVVFDNGFSFRHFLHCLDDIEQRPELLFLLRVHREGAFTIGDPCNTFIGEGSIQQPHLVSTRLNAAQRRVTVRQAALQPEPMLHSAGLNNRIGYVGHKKGGSDVINQLYNADVFVEKQVKAAASRGTLKELFNYYRLDPSHRFDRYRAWRKYPPRPNPYEVRYEILLENLKWALFAWFEIGELEFCERMVNTYAAPAKPGGGPGDRSFAYLAHADMSEFYGTTAQDGSDLLAA